MRLGLSAALGISAALTALGGPLTSAGATGGADGVIIQTTAADFNTCTALTGSFPTPQFSDVTLSPAGGGELRLTATIEDYFDGSVIDATRWITGTVYDWYTVPPVVSGGNLILDSAYLRSQLNMQALQPRFFEARALQRVIPTEDAGWPDLGFYREFPPLYYDANPPLPETSAIRLFVSRNDNSMFVRARDGGASAPLTDVEVTPAPDLTQYRVFRVEWDMTQTRFYVDGVLRATIAGTPALDTWAFLYSQEPAGLGSYSPMHVDWVRTGQYALSGAYTSCAQDAGGIVNWTTLTAETTTPSGTGVTFETRTSLDGVNWSGWQPVSAGAIASPSGRYLQYRAALTSASAMQSPEIAQVALQFFGPSSLQVSPAPATLDPGAVQAFTAQAVDSNSRAVTGLAYTWGLNNGGGSLNAAGVFTAGLPAGVFVNTVAATTTTTAGFLTGAATVTIRDLAPTANAGGPYTAVEGGAVNLTGSGQDPNGLPVAFSWDLDNNGSFETAGSSASFTRPDNGVFTVRLRVEETGGAGLSTIVTTPVTVTNAAPVVTITGAPGGSVTEGTAVTLGSTLTDAGSADTHTYAWSVTKNGSPYPPGGTGTAFTFTPDDNGTYVVTLTATDDDGGQGTDSETITVTNAAPVVTITGAPGGSVTEGTAVTLGSTLTDAGSADTHTYAWSVTKNGSPYPPGGTGTAFTFTPDDNGTYVVTLTATDDDGGQGTDSETITVTNAAPVVSLGAGLTLNQGAPLSRVGSFADPGADTHTAAVNYSDGAGTQALSLNPDKTFTLSRSYWAVGAFTVTVTVTDSSGAAGSGLLNIVWTNVTPTIESVTNNGPVLPGVMVAVVVTATDPGGAGDPLTYEFDCDNDGVFEIGPQSSRQADCAAADVGQQQVNVRVRDSFGAAALASTSVQVGARVYLPLITRNSVAVNAPDLVVDALAITSGQIVVTLRNQGSQPVVDDFWVDLYVAPSPPPTGVNQVWNDGRSAYGAVWGVGSVGLPLEPGETLILTLGDVHYQPARSQLPAVLAAGTLLMAQVDSANTATNYGAVLETHEVAGSAYNNLAQIVVALDTPLAQSPPGAPLSQVGPARP